MRNTLTRLGAACGIFACVWLLANAPPRAYATGNVLLPSEASGGGDSRPNLGLSPAKPSPAAPASPPTAAAAAAKGQANAPESFPALPPLRVPPPTVTEVPPIPKSPDSEAAPPVNASAAADLLAKFAPTKETPIPSMPPPTVTSSGSTTIIKTASMPSLSAMMPNMESLGIKMSRLNVTISNQSVWGPADIGKISDQLGIAPGKVPETCLLSLRGTLITSESAATFDTGAKGKDETLYIGTISNMYATVLALCPANGPVPPGKGIIQQVGDKYVVQLGFGSCPPRTAAPPTELIIHYAGNGQAKCEYQ